MRFTTSVVLLARVASTAAFAHGESGGRYSDAVARGTRSVCSAFLLLFAPPLFAEVTLRDAVESAWVRQPGHLARAARAEEFAAKRDATQALFPEPPSFVVSNRDDRLHRDQGARELSAGIALPLWLPGERGRQASIANAERDQYDAVLTAAKLRIAGEVRDAYWQVRLAGNELTLARRKVEEAATLAADVERRVKAGDLARVDLNQAQAAERLARGALAEAEFKAFRALQGFKVLTGLDTLPGGEETAAAYTAGVDDHPLLAPLQRAVATTQARLHLATRSLRDNPELELGLRRERGLFDEPYAHSLEVRLRLPFATEARNRPRIAAANAEMVEAQAAFALERTRLDAELEAARRELGQTRELLRLSEARFALAADTQQLLAKAFALGELDLAARLRAENERFEAELNFSRARLEAARAVSRLNQAQGVLP